MTDEERAKEYHAERDAEEWCDAAHYQFKKYMHKVGTAARFHRQSAVNQVEHDFRRNGMDNCPPVIAYSFYSKFIDRCIDVSKRDLETGEIPPAHSGFRSDDDGTAGYAWAVYNIDDLPSDVDLDGENLASDLTGWYRFERGPGRPFGSEPYVVTTVKNGVVKRMGRSRIIVKQFRGLDI